MTGAINIRGLCFSYGRQKVLDDISFSVPESGFFIIIGPNGSGKTTLMKSAAGIFKSSTGMIEIFGRAVSDYKRKELAQTIAFVPQEVHTDFPFTVSELVLMGRTPYQGMLGIPQKRDIEAAEQALEFGGIEHLAHRRLEQLSGGERQRVFIARAVCQQTRIILLDEPTASLDLAHQVKVMDLMERLKDEKGVTVVMVSHDVNLAALYGDTLLLLKDGAVVNLGSPGEVLTYSNIEDVYGCPVLVDESPFGGSPRVTPVPGRYIDRE